MGDDPISLIVAEGGEAATISTPAGGDGSSYDPTLPTNNPVGAATTAGVMGVWSNQVSEGMPAGTTAEFLISATGPPAGMTEGVSKLTRTLNGRSFRITRAKERTWLGQINGYVLGLGT